MHIRPDPPPSFINEISIPLQLHALGVNYSTMSVTAATAESFRFSATEYLGQNVAESSVSVPAGDGGCLVFDENSLLGKEEFCKWVSWTSNEPQIGSKWKCYI